MTPYGKRRRTAKWSALAHGAPITIQLIARVLTMIKEAQEASSRTTGFIAAMKDYRECGEFYQRYLIDSPEDRGYQEYKLKIKEGEK